jgi:hypothetical protein
LRRESRATSQKPAKASCERASALSTRQAYSAAPFVAGSLERTRQHACRGARGAHAGVSASPRACRHLLQAGTHAGPFAGVFGFLSGSSTLLVRVNPGQPGIALRHLLQAGTHAGPLTEVPEAHMHAGIETRGRDSQAIDGSEALRQVLICSFTALRRRRRRCGGGGGARARRRLEAGDAALDELGVRRRVVEGAHLHHVVVRAWGAERVGGG